VTDHVTLRLHTGGHYLTNYMTSEGNWLHQILFTGYIAKGVNTYCGSSFKSCELTQRYLEVPSVTATLLQTTTRGSYYAFGSQAFYMTNHVDIFAGSHPSLISYNVETNICAYFVIKLIHENCYLAT
jgi:hypothetical protein